MEGNVGFGYTAAAPSNLVSVNGAASIGNSYYSTTAPSNGLLVQGNVGIGDASPASMLTVGSGDLFQVNSSGNPVKINNVTTSFPSSQGAASSVLTNDGAGTLTWNASTSLQGKLAYTHNISTPTTGQTVTLTNNNYNIINPAGALLALTVNLPSSPANNDVVYIKFTQAITTVTYGNGTVADGIASPIAGGLVIFTYDSGTTTWY